LTTAAIASTLIRARSGVHLGGDEIIEALICGLHLRHHPFAVGHHDLALGSRVSRHTGPPGLRLSRGRFRRSLGHLSSEARHRRHQHGRQPATIAVTNLLSLMIVSLQRREGCPIRHSLRTGADIRFRNGRLPRRRQTTASAELIRGSPGLQQPVEVVNAGATVGQALEERLGRGGAEPPC